MKCKYCGFELTLSQVNGTWAWRAYNKPGAAYDWSYCSQAPLTLYNDGMAYWHVPDEVGQVRRIMEQYEAL